jgi:hypothetical protein
MDAIAAFNALPAERLEADLLACPHELRRIAMLRLERLLDG